MTEHGGRIAVREDKSNGSLDSSDKSTCSKVSYFQEAYLGCDIAYEYDRYRVINKLLSWNEVGLLGRGRLHLSLQTDEREATLDTGNFAYLRTHLCPPISVVRCELGKRLVKVLRCV